MPLPISGLYVIIDPAACGERDAIEVARMALDGGASMIQWRDKGRHPSEQLADARAISNLCHEYGALFIANDHADLAVRSGADGVHLGQSDGSIEDARVVVGSVRIVGVSTNNVEEALRAQAAGADYIAVGAIFPTRTKAVTRAASLHRLHEVDVAVHVPVVAIGGIDATNIRSVIDAGADAAAVISAVCSADDPRAAAAELSSAFAEGRRTSWD
jgi:thiamine-phosphate diphosphorylase